MADLSGCHNENWVPVPKASFLVKSIFNDSGYQMVATNVQSAYFEKCEISKIEKRFQDLNGHISMKRSTMMLHLKEGFEKALTEKDCISTNLDEEELHIYIQFYVGKFHSTYTFILRKDAEKLTEYVICPTVFQTLLHQKFIVEMYDTLKVMKNEAILPEICSDGPLPKTEPINPNWLSGINVPADELLDRFKKIQYLCDTLAHWNCKKYKKINSTQEKECTHSTENQDTTKDKDSTENEHLENTPSQDDKRGLEEETSIDESASQLKPVVKKKKVFKF